MGGMEIIRYNGDGIDDKEEKGEGEVCLSLLTFKAYYKDDHNNNDKRESERDGLEGSNDYLLVGTH